MAPDKKIASQFIAALAGLPASSAVVRLRFVHDRERGREAFEREGTLDKIWPELEAYQAQGYGAFYLLNECKAGPGSGRGGTAKDIDVIRVRALPADFDEGLPDEWSWHQHPSIVVHTSKGKGQALWRVADFDPATFKRTCRRLIEHYSSDPAVQNLARILRLPGTLHLKKEPRLVTFETFDSEWSYDGLAELSPERPPSPATGDPVDLDHLKHLLSFVKPDTRSDWRDLVAAVRATNAGEEDDRLNILLAKIDGDWHDEARTIWETMGPREGGVGFGTIYALATDGGYIGPATPGVSNTRVFNDVDLSAFARKEPAIIPARSWRPISETVLSEVGEVEELISGLVEKGITTFLSGPGGTNKSRLAVQWGMCIDCGEPVFGRLTKQATFRYLSYEDHADEVTRRMKAISGRLLLPALSGAWRDMTVAPKPLCIVGDQVEEQEFSLEVKDHLKSIEGHKFLVLDSTYDVLVFTGNAKVNESSVQAAIAYLDRLCAECDTTILCLWHPSQAGQDRGDASGWSVAWHNKPRARLGLDKHKDIENVYELSVKKRNNGPVPKAPLILHWDKGCLLPITEAATGEETKRFSDAMYHVAVAAAASGQPFTIQRKFQLWAIDEIELRSGRRPTEREAKEELARLQRIGRLRYIHGGRGKLAGYYSLTEIEPDDMDIETVGETDEGDGNTGPGNRESGEASTR